MDRKPLSSEEFKAIYSKVPRLCVDLIIRTEKGIVLTLRNLPSWNNQWHLPGGTVLYKETLEQAVAMIAQEELGIPVHIEKMLGYIEYPSEEKERGFGWAISIAFLCRTAAQDFKVNDEASKAGIFDQLPENLIHEQSSFLRAHWAEIER